MFTEEMPKQISGYFSLFESVASHFADRFTIERLSRQGELSIVFTTARGGGLLYFGLRWDLWTRMSLPLWTGVRPEWGEPAAEAFRLRHAGRAFQHEGLLLSPLDPGIAAPGGDPSGLIAVLDAELAAAGAGRGDDPEGQ